jgi:hypothetical protein
MALPKLKVGDEILIGKWLNRPAVIHGFGEDELGQPTVLTDKGEVKMFKFRIKSLMPGKESAMTTAKEVLTSVEGLLSEVKYSPGDIAKMRKELLSDYSQEEVDDMSDEEVIGAWQGATGYVEPDK